MDAETADDWTNFLNRLKNETSNQHIEIFNQTAIFKTFLESNNRSISQTESTLNEIANNINKLTHHTDSEFETLEKRFTIQSLFILAESVITEHERLYNQIRNTMIDVKRGRIPEVITKSALTNQLSNVSLTLTPEQRLPIDLSVDDPLHIFRFADISTVLLDNYLIVKIMIPNESGLTYTEIPQFQSVTTECASSAK